MKRKILPLCIAVAISISTVAYGNVENVTATKTSETIDSEISAESDTKPIEKKNYWKCISAVDEFGDPTNNSVVASLVEGTFSNTATNDSELNVTVYFESPYLVFHMLEYDDTPISYISSDELLLKAKIEENVFEYTLSGQAPSSDLYVSLMTDTGIANELGNALLGGANIKCVIYVGSSKYNFELNGSGLADTIDQMCNLEHSNIDNISSDEEALKNVDILTSHIFTDAYQFGDGSFENDPQYQSAWEYFNTHKDDFATLSDDELKNLLLGTWQEIYYYYYKIGYRTFLSDGIATQTVEINEKDRQWHVQNGNLLYGINEPSEYEVRAISNDVILLYDGYFKYIMLKRI